MLLYQLLHFLQWKSQWKTERKKNWTELWQHYSSILCFSLYCTEKWFWWFPDDTVHSPILPFPKDFCVDMEELVWWNVAEHGLIPQPIIWTYNGSDLDITICGMSMLFHQIAKAAGCWSKILKILPHLILPAWDCLKKIKLIVREVDRKGAIIL